MRFVKAWTPLLQLVHSMSSFSVCSISFETNWDTRSLLAAGISRSFTSRSCSETPNKRAIFQTVSMLIFLPEPGLLVREIYPALIPSAFSKSPRRRPFLRKRTPMFLIRRVLSKSPKLSTYSMMKESCSSISCWYTSASSGMCRSISSWIKVLIL